MPETSERQSPRLRLSARLAVVSIVALTTLITAAVAIGLQYHFSRALAIDAAASRYQLSARHTGEFVGLVERRARQLTQMLSRYPALLDANSPKPTSRDLFAEAMRYNRIFHSIYLGYPNGDFYQLVNLDNGEETRSMLGAKPEDRWLLMAVTESPAGERIRRFEYYDDDFQLRQTRAEPSHYDATEHRWYNRATDDQVIKSGPYLFQYIQRPGQTYSIGLPGNDLVLGIDITLASFSRHLRDQPLGNQAESYLYQPGGRVVASSQLARRERSDSVGVRLALSDTERAYLDRVSPLRISNELDWPPLDFAVAGQPQGFAVDYIRTLTDMLDVQVEFINGYTWPELVQAFQRGDIDVLQPVWDTEKNRQLGRLSDPLVTLPYAIARPGGEPLPQNLADLEGRRIAIPEGWSIIELLRRYDVNMDIVEVSSPRQALQQVLAGQVYGAVDTSAIMEYTAEQYFIEGLVFHRDLNWEDAGLPTELHLMVKPQHQALLPLFNRAIAAFPPERKGLLARKWLAKDEDGYRDSLATVPYEFMIDSAADPDRQGRLYPVAVDDREYFAYVEPLGETPSDYFAVVVPRDAVLQASLQRVQFSIWVTLGCLLLLLPLSWWLAEPIVRPIRRLFDQSHSVQKRHFDEVTHFPSRIKELDRLSGAMVAMADSIGEYQAHQRELMDSFIELIADAIDHKSPYTGGHCARVPELGIMIAEAAHRDQSGPYRDFEFADEDEHREFRIAAWLHDCGKITVPEHVVDKGTKLEAIYNRIHEVRMRFEVLWRDAHIEYLQASAHNLEDEAGLKATLELRQQQLQDDFAFIARVNVGGEFLSDEDKQRLSRLAGITYQRHFSDRLGLSPVEEARFDGPEASLPATEWLLADKPEHLIPHPRPTTYDPSFGINMEVPAYRANLGELHNLTVSRGTLTPEDRFKIQEHMISTIQMLEALPFPPELSRVPRYASTHHETLKGTGYPRKLTGEDLSIPERILAIADIFEALTAADRPYKRAKTVSEALSIMHKMALDDHIDRQLFEFFLTSGVYLEYARRYLAPEQIDEVDIQAYIGG